MIWFLIIGGVNEIRTRDLLHAMQTRYQLRYIPIYLKFCKIWNLLKITSWIFASVNIKIIFLQILIFMIL